MHVMLKLNEKNGSLTVMVKLEKPLIERRVTSLLEENNNCEAFRLLRSHAEVVGYYPKGVKIPFRPRVTLVEDHS